MAGVGLHYQRFYRTFSTGTSALVFAPELGVNNYYSHPSLGRYQVLGSVVGGSYIYSGQNLTYVRFNLGVEYAF